MTPVTIKLYQTSSEPTVVNKILTNEITVSGYFKQVQDISAPVIDLAFNEDNFDTYFNANYACIEVFHRYYFISRREIGMNNILSIYMDEDVLMSFKNEIYALEPLVIRQATDYNESLVDGDIPIKSIPKVTVIGSDFLTWGSASITEIKGNEGETVYKSIVYSVNYDSTHFFKLSGDIVMQCFTNVPSTEKDSFCNGLVSSNRYYDISIKGFEQIYNKITAPSFWQSMSNWFSDYSQAIMDIDRKSVV